MKKNNKKKIFSAFAVLALSAATACAAIPFTACGGPGGAPKIEGKTYWVTPEGTSGGDGSYQNPMDITTALSVGLDDNFSHRLAPGDKVLVKPGHYTGLTDSIHMKAGGSFNGLVTVRAATEADGLSSQEVGDGKVTLDFSDMTFLGTNRGVQIECNYVYWYGIDICGAGDNGMYVAGSYNTVENCEFYNNRDTGLQLGRMQSADATIDLWPSFNLVKNCTSHNNYDNETYGENADGFAAKLTVGYGNVFDGCIAYRNSDDGWDLYAKSESGNIGQVIIYNCVAFENGYLEYDQVTCNRMYSEWTGDYSENAAEIEKVSGVIQDTDAKYGKHSFKTRDGDGNGFKLGGSVMEGDVLVYNCIAYGNRMHGVTDNSNPGFLKVVGVTSYNNSAAVDDDPASATYGQVIDIENHDEHNNIDLARQSYSYNAVNHVLSLSDSYAKSVGSDEYRGSVVDSILYAKSKANKVDGSIDANTKRDKADAIIGPVNTSAIAALKPTEIFETLPFTKAESTYTHNLSGYKDMGENYAGGAATNPNRVHLKYRNADGSINMGGILAVKDYSKLLGADNKIGAVLNHGSWEDYTHFVNEDLYDYVDNAASAILIKSMETLTLNVDETAVYQDFDAPALLINTTVTWGSSDESILKINKGTDESPSKSQYTTIEVARPTDGDREVTLTATLSYHNRTTYKEFKLNVKKDEPRIGTLFVHVDSNGEDIVDGGNLILDMYRQLAEPVLHVENGAYYSNKLLLDSQYVGKTTYEYAVSDNETYSEVNSFNPNKPGVYKITHEVKLVGSDKSSSMTYKIFVASTSANVDFTTIVNEDDEVVEGSKLTVYRDGYNISGDLANVTGSLYAVAVPADKAGEVTDQTIKTYEGVKTYDFRSTSISFNFANPNTQAYTVCYALANVDGTITSQVYKKPVEVVEIDTEAAFMKIAGGDTIDEESVSQTIYLLTKDLDFSGKTFSREAKAFKGLFNGNGHTISNITITSTGNGKNVGVFYRLDGGTIENVKFNNIKITSGGEKSGLITECNGGYLHNIAITDIDVRSTAQRASGLIAVINIGVPTYISQVSIINSEGYEIRGEQRVGGLVGFSQASSSAPSGNIEVYISDCYVEADICAGFELGGIYGTYDCGNNKNCYYYLQVEHCVYNGKITATGSKTFMGGILGYQKGAYSQMFINGCMNIGEMWFSGAKIDQGLKNASGILGSSITLDVDMVCRVINCATLIEEYNSNFDVASDTYFNMVVTYRNRLGFDCEYPNVDYTGRTEPFKWTLLYEEGSTSTLEAPYISLNFLGDWN